MVLILNPSSFFPTLSPLSPTTPYSLQGEGHRSWLNSPPGTLLQDPAYCSLQKKSPPPLSLHLNRIDFAKQRGRSTACQVTRKLAAPKQAVATPNRMQILKHGILKTVDELSGRLDKNYCSGFHFQEETMDTRSPTLLCP